MVKILIIILILIVAYLIYLAFVAICRAMSDEFYIDNDDVGEKIRSFCTIIAPYPIINIIACVLFCLYWLGDKVFGKSVKYIYESFSDSKSELEKFKKTKSVQEIRKEKISSLNPWYKFW